MPRSRTNLPVSPEASAQREPEKRRLIEERWNHPSIIACCPFNESWGQHDTLRYTTWIKELDPSRLVDEASGFPWHGGGDIQDNHGGISPPNPRQIGIVSENGDANGMTGQFFCQLYDTESECDGLVSHDRAVWKADPDIIRAAAERLSSEALRTGE